MATGGWAWLMARWGIRGPWASDPVAAVSPTLAGRVVVLVGEVRRLAVSPGAGVGWDKSASCWSCGASLPGVGTGVHLPGCEWGPALAAVAAWDGATMAGASLDAARALAWASLAYCYPGGGRCRHDCQALWGAVHHHRSCRVFGLASAAWAVLDGLAGRDSA